MATAIRKMFKSRSTMLCLALIVIVSSSGCVGAMAQLMYLVKGHTIPAAYSDLEGKRVAVVCVSDASAYGPDTLTFTISNAVSLKLARAVPDIEVVPQRSIEQWVDTNGWTETEFVEIGKGVNADMVLAIEVASYSIHEGQTMYKGRADITATVFDLEKGGQVTYVHGPEHYTFPENGRPAIQTSDKKFETVFLHKLTENLVRQFSVHEKGSTFAEDASLLNY